MTIRVVNKAKHRGPGEYIGRPSILGNPFVIGKDGDRMAVIHKYHDWFWHEMDNPKSPVGDEIGRLVSLAREGDLNLICWCSPQPCHGQLIKVVIEAQLLLDVEQTRAEILANTQ